MARNTLDVKLTGVKDLFRNLDKLEKKINNQLEGIIKKAAKIILDDMKKRVPVDTRQLKESLDIKKLEVLKNGIRIGIGPVGEDVYYWFFVEYGTANMAAANQGKGFMRPAFDNNKDAVKKEIGKELKKLVAREGIR